MEGGWKMMSRGLSLKKSEIEVKPQNGMAAEGETDARWLVQRTHVVARIACDRLHDMQPGRKTNTWAWEQLRNSRVIDPLFPASENPCRGIIDK